MVAPEPLALCPDGVDDRLRGVARVADAGLAAIALPAKGEHPRIVWQASIDGTPVNALVAATHDDDFVRDFADRVVVMREGTVREQGEVADIFARPQDAYTKALLAAVPIADPELEAMRTQQMITGEVPSVLNPPSGCPFHPRCPIAIERCAQEEPPFQEHAPGHSAACSAAIASSARRLAGRPASRAARAMR